MDSEYLKRHVGTALSLGLSEVCQKKPADPIDYLANWLRKFVQNEENKRQVEKEEELLRKERMIAAEEERVQAAMLEEQNQIAQELLKREMEKEKNNTITETKEEEKQNVEKEKVNEKSSKSENLDAEFANTPGTDNPSVTVVEATASNPGISISRHGATSEDIEENRDLVSHSGEQDGNIDAVAEKPADDEGDVTNDEENTDIDMKDSLDVN
ncbi:DPY30 domain-containing protein 1-like [Hydractinia symbiolongicarpus]|uniref:DPY30 domain-containing protein 1-like n=1 Tax=Hydractinia symbiolongicarpus TaxID=13093 RepID=UPI00254DB300|nr:DPY30 domain-containing protein 1-like [Hydractinia symbiolongicarpus]